MDNIKDAIKFVEANITINQYNKEPALFNLIKALKIIINHIQKIEAENTKLKLDNKLKNESN